MNALDFVFNPLRDFTSVYSLPFTIPATASKLVTAANVATATTSPAALPSEAVVAAADAFTQYNTSTPMGFLLYVAAQSQKVLLNGAAGGILFGGPTRSYWILTLFMVHIPYRLLQICSVVCEQR